MFALMSHLIWLISPPCDHRASRAIFISEPKPYLFKSTPIAGEHGKNLKFMFRYRSHSEYMISCLALILTFAVGLQTIGCIQRTPSPGPTGEQAPVDSKEQEKVPQLALIKVEVELETNIAQKRS